MRLPSIAGPLAVFATLLGVALVAQAQVKVDPRLPAYKPVDGLSGNLRSRGSDAMNNLMALWAEGFRNHYPTVHVEVEGEAASTALPALIAGVAEFGTVSRPVQQAHLDRFEAKFGYKPTALPTSLDMLAIYVHKDNPIKSLTLPQVDAIYSKTRKAGYEKDIKTWGDLGLTGEWADKPIRLYGRNSASGTYGFVKERVLLRGDFKDSVVGLPGSTAVVRTVAGDRHAMGYSGIGYKTPDVRAVPLAKDAKSKPIAVELENGYNGEYPLARFLYVHVNYKPKSELDPLRRKFLKYAFSKEGQQDVVKDGYYPVTADIAAKALKSVGVEASTTGDK